MQFTTTKTFNLSRSPPRLSSYRRLNSQHEYERLFHEFSSVANDELDVCLSANNNNNKPGKYKYPIV
jgi:hypothetical protein